MKKILMFIVMTVLTLPAVSQDSPIRIAVIDVTRVIAESAAGQAASGRLNKMLAEHAREAERMDEEIRKLENEISVLRKSPAVNRSALEGKVKLFSDKRTAKEVASSEANRKINEARGKELQALDEKIQPIVRALAKEINLAAVFNKFESGLIFAADAIDITDLVIKRFDAATKK